MKPPKYVLKATIGIKGSTGMSCTWESVIYGLLQYFDDIGLHYIPGREDQSGRLVLEFPSVSEFLKLKSGMWQVHNLGFSLDGIWLDTEYCIYLPGYPERPRYGLYSIFGFSDTTGDITVRELPIVPTDGAIGKYVKMVYSPEHGKVISHFDKSENRYIGNFTDCTEYFINAREELGKEELGIDLSEAIMITNEIYRLDMMTPTEEEHYLKVLEKEALKYVR